MADFMQQRRDLVADPSKFVRGHMANVHMWEAHEQTSHTRLLNNVLKPGRIGGKYGDSQFRRVQNADLGEECVRKLLELNIAAIERYVENYRNDPANTPDSMLYHMECMAKQPDGTLIPDYIGFGYRLVGATKDKYGGGVTHVEAVKTNAVACIVRPSVDSPDGWEITSAFPMVTPRPAEMTGQTSIKPVEKNFGHILRNTLAYKDANPVLKAYMETTCAGSPKDPKYRTVYSPKTPTRPPIIMISPDTKYPGNSSQYPRIVIYANENPPANARVFLWNDKKFQLGSEKSLERLRDIDPGLADLYDGIVGKLPDEFRPNGLPYNHPAPDGQKPEPRKVPVDGPEPVTDGKPASRDGTRTKEERKPEPGKTRPDERPMRRSRSDPRFDAIADEIAGAAPETGQEQTYTGLN